ncbi:kinase-like protein, partial [Rhizophagus irregularis]
NSRQSSFIAGRKKCKYPYLHWKRLRDNEAWCRCDSQRLTKGWTSGHKGIDQFMKETQLKAKNRTDPFLEWIPYNRFININEIGEGGFSIVYSAEWYDLEKRLSWAAPSKARPVALKSIKNSQDMTSEYINELQTHYRCVSATPSHVEKMRFDHGFLRFFGITQDPETHDYIMVTELAPYHDLRDFLQNDFAGLDWSSKLYLLRNISGNLLTIHKAGFTHRDLHPGNILVGQVKKDGKIVTVAKLAHLGLSRPANKGGALDGLYGVLPYFAPEVLQGKKYTKSADIYCIGIIMAELSSGIPPFVDRPHDTKLAIEICEGLRPSFAEGTPENYVRLATQCFHMNPSERPDARFLAHTFNNWWNLTQEDNVLSNAFITADEKISELDTSFNKHPDAIYTSRLITFENSDSNSSDKTLNYLPPNVVKQI